MICSLSLDWDDADAEAVLSVSTVKSNLLIYHDERDNVIIDLLSAAVGWAEGVMHRSILAKSHRWVLKEFPYHNETIRLPRGKTQSVDSIYAYVGDTYTNVNFQSNLSQDSGGLLMPALTTCWPAVNCYYATPVTITFTAGWTASTIPYDIKIAMMAWIGKRLDLPGYETMSEDYIDSMLSAWVIRGA